MLYFVIHCWKIFYFLLMDELFELHLFVMFLRMSVNQLHVGRKQICWKKRSPVSAFSATLK